MSVEHVIHESFNIRSVALAAMGIRQQPAINTFHTKKNKKN